MNGYAILTNRKRAIVALVHSFVFFGVALHGFLAPKGGILRGGAPTGDFILVMVYLTVTAILAWLVGVSRGVRERLYFACCTSSATFGLLRTTFGDAAIPAAQYLRVAMLTSAIIVGILILRSFSLAVVRAASEITE
jgi:hypothetical protein